MTKKKKEKNLLHLPLSEILLSSRNPRKDLESEKAKRGIKDLATNIMESGLIQPIVLVNVDEIPKDMHKAAMLRTQKVFGRSVAKTKKAPWMIKCGERRVRAIKSCWTAFHKKFGNIPSVTAPFEGELEMIRDMTAENVARKSINPIEAAASLLEIKNILHKRLGREPMIKEIAKASGYNPSYTGSVLALLNMPKDIIDAVRDKKLNPIDANMLKRIENEQERADIIAAKGTMKDGDWRVWLKEKAPKIIRVGDIATSRDPLMKQPPPPPEPERIVPDTPVRISPFDVFGEMGRPAECQCWECPHTNKKCSLKPRKLK